MSTLVDFLEQTADAVGATASTMYGDRTLRGASDDEVVSVLATAARLQRSIEAIMVDAVAQLAERTDVRSHADQPATVRGCRSIGELIQRATRLSQRSATDLARAATAVRESTAPTSGELLPAELPQLRVALGDSEVGVDGVVAVATTLRGCLGGVAGILAADEELAAAARGQGVDGAPPALPDELRAYATVWAMYLDQDGAEPREARAMRKRGLTLGRVREGLVPVRGALLPEVAAQLQNGFDALLNPKIDGDALPGPRFHDPAEVAPSGDESNNPGGPVPAAADDRTRAQRQHDALAILLSVSAASGDLPALGGAAPVLVISAREEDVVSGRGYAHVSGADEPISLAGARHVACTGVVQRVVTAGDGRIVSLQTFDRVFNHHQRRAIALRDGGCAIPGCTVPAAWCEIHHVLEHARGGPTHTDNGVLLCWFHHRTLDTSGWKVRMQNGVPHVRGPAWWDPQVRWRPVTKSPTRMRERLAQRHRSVRRS